MFGFLISHEVNDDAVRLKQLVDIMGSKYLHLSNTELRSKIKRDFDADNYRIDPSDDFIILTFEELSYFVFNIFENKLMVEGNGKYAGFTLHANTTIFCNVENGLFNNATGGARKLAKMMKKKFDFTNLTGRI